MAALKKKKINLVVRDGFEHTSLGRALTWGLSVGRVIVILTELVVIGAFLSRFWLDRQLTDLHEVNAQKRKQIEAASKFESEFRTTQQQIDIYKKVTSSTTRSSTSIKDIAKYLPEGVLIERISISTKDGLDIAGNALSEADLAGFLNSLRSSKKYETVQLTSITLATEGAQGFNFTIKAGGSKKMGTTNQ